MPSRNTIVVGNVVYSKMDDPHFYKGISLNDSDFQQIMLYVKPRYTEKKLNEKLTREFASVAKCEFETKILDDIIETTPEPAYWRVGEHIAMCYLEDQNLAYFPYANNDKNPDAYNPGIDLLGFSSSDNEVTFLIGEVKTSYDKKSPPSLMYGDGGLNNQLKIIACGNRKKKISIKWMLSNAPDDDKRAMNMLTSALTVYFESKKIKIMGILIRSTVPNKSDLTSTYNKIKNMIDSPSSLNLFSIYLPVNVRSLANYVM